MSDSDRSYMDRCYHLANWIQTDAVNFAKCLGFTTKKKDHHAFSDNQIISEENITEEKTFRSKEYNSLKKFLRL